jgi:hypothetical protein
MFYHRSVAKPSFLGVFPIQSVKKSYILLNKITNYAGMNMAYEILLGLNLRKPHFNVILNIP